MQRVIPAFRISSFERSKKFYTEDLNFQVDWVHQFEPGLPAFAQITKDGMSFYLTEHTGDCEAGGLIHLFIDNVDGWYEELRHLPDIQPPNEDIGGLRMFSVTDPDGNEIRIAERLISTT